jgi:diguanylate cyclase (GGDEF)-like protein
MVSDQQRVGRREWWLWFSAVNVTILTAITFLLSAFHSLFLNTEHFYELRSDQARWGVLNLLLLFNAWMLYRQWWFRRLRRQLSEPAEADGPADLEEVYDPSRMDRATGLFTRASVEPMLGKAVARAKRQNVPLSLLAVHLEDFAQVSERYGSATCDQLLREFADRLRKASRGCDFGVRLTNDDFLLFLPECSVSDAKIVSDRLGTVEMKVSGKNVALNYSIGWIDYKSGEVPSDLIKRAQEVLHLYEEASNDTSSERLVLH